MDWKPEYAQEDSYTVDEDDTQLKAFQQLSEVRAKLSIEMQHRLDQQTDQSLQKLLQSGITKLAEQVIPLGTPDAIPRPNGKKKRIQGGSRLETGPEAAKRIALLRERALKKQLLKDPTFTTKAIATTTKAIATPFEAVPMVVVANSPQQEPSPRPKTPLESSISSPWRETLQSSIHKRNHSALVDRMPDKPYIIPPPTFINTLDFEPPSSTAPAAIGRRSGRANQATNTEWREALIPKERKKASK